MDQLINIEILGQSFSFKTDSDVSAARAVADYVTETVDQIKSQCAQKSPAPDKRAILILTALQIASEYFDLKNKHQTLLHDISKRSENMLNALESEVELSNPANSARL